MKRTVTVRALVALVPVIAVPWTACEGRLARPGSDLTLTQIDTVVSMESGLLAEPADLAVDGEGRVYVLDYQLAAVVVLTGPDDPPVLYGREGEGPGELKGPASLAVTGDTIRIVELGNGRVQALTADGTHARSYPLPAAFPGGISISPAGRLAVPTQGFRENSLVLLFDAAGVPTGRAGEPVVPPHQMWDMAEIRSEIERDRVPASLRNMSLPVIQDDGSLWLILNAEGIVQRHDGTGSLMWSALLESPELEVIRQDFLTRNRELTTPGFIALSYVSDAVIVEGELWLLLNTPAGDPTVVLVMAADGRLDRRIRIPDLHGAGDMTVDRQRRLIYFTVPNEAMLVAVPLPAG